MIPGTNIEIIMKNYIGYLEPITNMPFTAENSQGETVPVTFSVGCKFKFDGEEYGDYIMFIGEEPALGAIEEAANQVFKLALDSYINLCTGDQSVTTHLLFDKTVSGPIKTIESGGTEVK